MGVNLNEIEEGRLSVAAMTEVSRYITLSCVSNHSADSTKIREKTRSTPTRIVRHCGSQVSEDTSHRAQRQPVMTHYRNEQLATAPCNHSCGRRRKNYAKQNEQDVGGADHVDLFFDGRVEVGRGGIVGTVGGIRCGRRGGIADYAGTKSR